MSRLVSYSDPRAPHWWSRGWRLLTNCNVWVECPTSLSHRLPPVVARYAQVGAAAKPANENVWVYRVTVDVPSRWQVAVPLDLLGWADEQKHSCVLVPGWGVMYKGGADADSDCDVHFELAPWMKRGPAGDRVAFAIVGCGQRGTGYARVLSRLQCGIQPLALVGVYDTVRSKATSLQSRAAEWGLNTRVFDTSEELCKAMKERKDVVPIVCTPDERHIFDLQVFGRCARLCILEKPVVQNAAELHTLRRLLTTVSVHVPYVLRYSRLWKTARSVLDSKPRPRSVELVLRLTPEHTASFVRRTTTGSSLARFVRTKLCHDVDLLMWLTGSATEPRPVVTCGTGLMKNSDPPELLGASCTSCPVSGCLYRYQGHYGVGDTCVVGHTFFDHLWISGFFRNRTPYSIHVEFHCSQGGRELRVHQADGTTLCVDSVRNTVHEGGQLMATGGSQGFHNGGDLTFVHEVMRGSPFSHAYLRPTVLWIEHVVAEVTEVTEDLTW